MKSSVARAELSANAEQALSSEPRNTDADNREQGSEESTEDQRYSLLQLELNLRNYNRRMTQLLHSAIRSTVWWWEEGRSKLRNGRLHLADRRKWKTRTHRMNVIKL